MLDTHSHHSLQDGPVGLAFGRFVLRRRERLLLRDGVPLELGSRAVEILLLLLEADGALLDKHALLDRVWPGVIVEENNLQVQISALRRVLSPGGRDWIATVPGRGYRFVGRVSAWLGDGATPLPHLLHLPQAPPMSVLVLPFAGHGADPAGSWFADGVTASLTTDLARTLPSGSTVLDPATADTHRGGLGDARAIGREHGVCFLVEGSVLLTGSQARVNARLVSADTGAHLWADRFDTPQRNTLDAQDGIVGRLARSLTLELVNEGARRAEEAEEKHPGEGTAQDYVLRARAAASHRMMTRVNFELTCALYAQALERDPVNADALAGIACQRVFQVMNGYVDGGRIVRDEAARELHLLEAEDALARAFAAAPGHPEALRARALLLRARGQFADAAVATEAVLAHAPGDPTAHREMGLNLLYMGRTEDALAAFCRADVFGPDDPARWTWLQGLGRALIQLGRDAEAADALRHTVASNPSFASGHALLAAALVLAGKAPQARAAIAEFRRAEPDTSPELLARRSAVPFEATDPLYQGRNGRVLDGLRRAIALLAA